MRRIAIEMLVQAYANQQANRTGAGAFGHVETGLEALTLHEIVERIEREFTAGGVN